MSPKITVNSIRKFYKNNKKITMLTCYDYSTAKFLDEAGIDCILIGDSLAMVALGYENTCSVGMEEMLIFTKAVAKGAKAPLIIADMPFMSYHSSIEQAAENAGKFIKAGANAVKIEGGGKYILSVVEHLVQVGIPVVAHLGFTPQFLNTIGGYLIQGKTNDKTDKILEQAKLLEKAGAFMLVLEMIPEEASEFITKNISVPTIGIGAGCRTSGQVLVIDDLLGKFADFTPKFVRKYADLHGVLKSAIENYIQDVENENYPNKEESFHLIKEEVEKLGK